MTTIVGVEAKPAATLSSKKAVLGAFAELAVKDGFVSLEALRTLRPEWGEAKLARVIEELRADGLLTVTYEYDLGPGIRLTAKGAVRLWFWLWPEETGKPV